MAEFVSINSVLAEVQNGTQFVAKEGSAIEINPDDSDDVYSNVALPLTLIVFACPILILTLVCLIQQRNRSAQYRAVSESQGTQSLPSSLKRRRSSENRTRATHVSCVPLAPISETVHESCGFLGECQATAVVQVVPSEQVNNLVPCAPDTKL